MPNLSLRCKKITVLVITFTCLVSYFVFKNPGTVLKRDVATIADKEKKATHSRIVSDQHSSMKCKFVDAFAFVKTHKTGSSTMSNILLRFTEVHGLNQLLAIYPGGTEYGQLEDRKYIDLHPKTEYNAFVMHAKYNPEFLRTKMPTRTRFITFIRHPVSRYLSAFRFFNLYKNYVDSEADFDHAVNMHIDANSDYLRSTAYCSKCKNTVNSVASDLGFDFSQYVTSQNKTRFIADFLAERDKELDLVLISEYYDLSLILLKRRFCWTYDDIVYVKSLESSKKPKVEDTTSDRLDKFQLVDSTIYNHYNKTFWDLVSKDDGIYDDLTLFREHNSRTRQKCFNGKKLGMKGTYEYKLSDYGKSSFLCKAMNTRVLPFARLLQISDEGLEGIKVDEDEDTLNLSDVYELREKHQSNSRNTHL